MNDPREAKRASMDTTTKAIVAVSSLVAAFGVGLAVVGLLRHAEHAPATSADGAPASPDEAGAFCERHQIAESRCPWCDPSLIESLGWCDGHGVPEALCSRCTPALIPGFKAENDWCAGHDVPESQCELCDHGPTEQTPPPAPGVALVPLDEVPRSARAPSPRCSTESLQIRFDSPRIARDAGLAFATAAEREVAFSLTCTAELKYDQNRYAHVAARAPGVLEAVLKDLGASVAEGERLALVTSAELGAAKAELLQARSLADLWERNTARERRLAEQRVATERDLLQAETELAKTRVAVSGATQRLRSLGLSDAQIAAVCSSQDTSAALPVVAPFAGTVVARDAVVGEVIRTDRPLFGVADTSSLWAMLDVQATDARSVEPGQPVMLTLNGLPGEAIPGAITWVSAELDHRTRTVRARAVVENPRGSFAPACSAARWSRSTARARTCSSPRKPCSGRAAATWSSSAAATSCSSHARSCWASRRAPTGWSSRASSRGRPSSRPGASCSRPSCSRETLAPAAAKSSQGVRRAEEQSC